MFKNVIKRFIFSFFLLYGFNVFSVKFNIIVPINFLTMLVIYLLDIPGLVLLNLIFLIVA